MSYYKLFDLKDIGLNSYSIGNLLYKFQSLGNKALITYDDIYKSIGQKLLVDEVVTFLLEKEIIELNSENEENIFKIIVEFPKTSLEKESKEYIDKKLFSAQKELLVKKIQSFSRKEQEAYILFLDLANSTDNYNGNSIKRNKILNKSFPNILQSSIEPFFNALKGYMIHRKGDEAHFLFFNKEDLDKFLKLFINKYKDEIFDEIEEYNKTRNIENKFTDKMYLKVFIAHSVVSEPDIDGGMPNFSSMDAFTIIARIEKPFKKELKDKVSEIDMYFIVSKDNFEDSEKVLLDTQDGEIEVYYKIY